MDLLNILKEEINKLKLTDKLKIAQYIYIKIGKLFEYDPLWLFSTSHEKEIIKNKKINIRNVTDFDITCFSWAVMYTELLKNFGIVSRVKYLEDSFYDKETMSTVKKSSHAYVEILINGKIHIADLTASFKDMIGIKLGINTYYNCQLSKKYGEDKYEFSEVCSDIYNIRQDINQVIEQIKQKLLESKFSLSSEKYTYNVYRVIEDLIKQVRIDADYVVGMKYIDFLLQTFISKDYQPNKIYFYNKEKQIYITVYQVNLNGSIYYLSYEKHHNGLYEFEEINQERFNLYSKLYDSKKSMNWQKDVQKVK